MRDPHRQVALPQMAIIILQSKKGRRKRMQGDLRQRQRDFLQISLKGYMTWRCSLKEAAPAWII